MPTPLRQETNQAARWPMCEWTLYDMTLATLLARSFAKVCQGERDCPKSKLELLAGAQSRDFPGFLAFFGLQFCLQAFLITPSMTLDGPVLCFTNPAGRVPRLWRKPHQQRRRRPKLRPKAKFSTTLP